MTAVRPEVPTAATHPAGSRVRGVLPPMGVLGLVTLVVAYVGSIDPHTPGHYPVCPVLWITGLQCPGCGSLRALHDLVHGDVLGAIGMNAVAVAVVPLLGYWWLRWARRSWLGTPPPALAAPLLGWLLLGAIAAFWVVRNLPGGAALAA